MRVAIFTECYKPVANGVVTSVVTLRDALRADGHRAYIFAPGASQPDDVDVFRVPALPFPRYPFPPARPFPRLPAEFARLNIDVIHCQHPFTMGHLGAETARRYRLPLVYTAHSLYDAMAATSKSTLVRTLGQPAARGVVRRFCARADAVIVPSRYTRSALLADGVRAPFIVVPTGVPPLVSDPDGRARIRAGLGLGEETPLLLYLGRLGPEKRVDVLLHATAALEARNLPAPLCDFRLAIVGDGQCRPMLAALASELGVQGRVEFTGVQPHCEIANWYAAADIFVLASPEETQGLALIEAMQMRLPCVSIRSGGPVEIVQDGITGRLTALDPQPFADTIEALLREPALRAQYGEMGRARAQNYTPEAMAQGVLAVYEQVCRKRIFRSQKRSGKVRSLLKVSGKRKEERGKRA